LLEPKEKERGTQLTREFFSFNLSRARNQDFYDTVSKTCPHRVVSRTRMVQLTRQACASSCIGALCLAFGGSRGLRFFQTSEGLDGAIFGFFVGVCRQQVLCVSSCLCFVVVIVVSKRVLTLFIVPHFFSPTHCLCGVRATVVLTKHQPLSPLPRVCIASWRVHTLPSCLWPVEATKQYIFSSPLADWGPCLSP